MFDLEYIKKRKHFAHIKYYLKHKPHSRLEYEKRVFSIENES